LAEPTLVVLAAGRGTRFGGPKQLAVVRADGATVTDVLAERAAAAGITQTVVVASPATATAFERYPVVVQEHRRGTADAVLRIRGTVAGSFIVVNGDDIYPARAFALLARHLRTAPDAEHAMIGFRLDRTLVGTEPESRALLTVDGDILTGVREGRVEKDGNTLRFVRAGGTEPVAADAAVSMNIWAFRPDVFEALATVVAATGAGEVYLPDVVAALIDQGAVVRVIPSAERCIGLTYATDLDAVRAALA
jgi:bifunctional N-acetylglucosamine-1-phosphate-uridyltransferase/glucosamine-1-phosphate-acetyltransferase GlmU-like protein